MESKTPPETTSIAPTNEIKSEDHNGKETRIVIDGAQNDNNISSETKEKEDVKKKLPSMTSYAALFRYATALDYFLMFLGVITAMASGAALPVLSVVIGDLVSIFTDLGKEVYLFKAEKMVTVGVIGVIACVMAATQMACWQIVAERQSSAIKAKYLEALLRQEIAFFDGLGRGELSSSLHTECAHIKEGINDRVATTVQALSSTITGFTVAFVRGSDLALILLICLPFLVGSAALTGKLITALTKKSLAAYTSAGSLAEEALAAIRTIVSFGGEGKILKRYINHLGVAYKQDVKKAFSSGIGISAIFFCIYCMYALGIFYSSILMVNSDFKVGTMVNVFMAFIIGAFSLGNAAPNISYFVTAKVAGYKIFSVIDRKTSVDPISETGERPGLLKNEIRFEGVDFSYPIRPDAKVLKNFCVTFSQGKTVALVGQSGSGKSTCISLLERFYLPHSGKIFFDGVPIENLHVRSLRGLIGYVGQEPVLFTGTIRENVAWGIAGLQKEFAPDGSPLEMPSDEKIWAALRQANAEDFVQMLPKKLDTQIGEGGSNLSGGQKQRIAIARALIRDPPIVCFDEATSALDTKSEQVVQEALNNASIGRTTILIAHRLSTVRNANNIVAMKKGEIVEVGTHQELVEKKGFYYELTAGQRVMAENEESDDSSSDADDEDNNAAPGSPTSLTAPSPVSPLSIQSMHSVSPPMTRLTLKDEVKTESSPVWRAMRMNKENWVLIVIGILAACLGGGVTPTYGIFYSNAVNDLYAAKTPDETKQKGAFWALAFFGLALCASAASYIQTAAFGMSGARLIVKLRTEVFRALLRQEIGFYDREENGVGVLAATLSVQAISVQNLVGDSMGTILQVSATLIVGAILALCYGWKLALVVIAASPMIIFSGMYQSRVQRGTNSLEDETEANRLSSEIVSNMRTVASLGLEKCFLQRYVHNLNLVKRRRWKSILLGSIFFGLSSAATFIVYIIAYEFGGYLMINDPEYDFQKFFSVLTVVIFSAAMGGRISSFLPDYAKAFDSAVHVFRIMDRKSDINFEDQEGAERITNIEQVKGSVSFEKVRFRYPSRPEVKVHRGMTFSVEPGMKVALVGTSGCGKTTCIQLLERFYNARAGQITIDGRNIESLNLRDLRGALALVGQEPVLLKGTVRSNIAFGVSDDREVTDAEIEGAARAANVHEFISRLPEGYDTPVGDKGSMLSGGQKQRVAIARALIRKPRILLLDEATSALDAESEAVVQAALDEAAKGRTTIVVAHRLSTIKNADIIVVLRDGKVREQGTHKQLMALRGLYYTLFQGQTDSAI